MCYVEKALGLGRSGPAMRGLFVALLLIAAAVHAQSQYPPAFSSGFRVELSVVSTVGSATQTSDVLLRWSAVPYINAWRTDERVGGAQTVRTTLVTYNGAAAYVFSPNNSVCSAYCLPLGLGGSLPTLRVQDTDAKARALMPPPRALCHPLTGAQGTTTNLPGRDGQQLWQRTQRGGPYNATVTYAVTVPDFGAPVLASVAAQYALGARVVAARRCQADLSTYTEVDNPDVAVFRCAVAMP